MSDNNNGSFKEMSLQEGIVSKMHIPALVYTNYLKYVVAHSNVEVSRVRQLSEVPFTENTLKSMQDLNIKDLTRIQTYSWPHLCKGDDHGVYIISTQLSGRSIGYLLPLCDTVSKIVSEQTDLLAKGGSALGSGPLSIVVTADVNRLENIVKRCKVMLNNVPHGDWITMVATISSKDCENIIYQLLNNVGCLVVTLAQFVRLKLYAKSVKFTELRYLVFDDVDIMEPYVFKKAFQYLHEVVKNTMRPRAQLVLVSQYYDPLNLQKLRAFNKYPMLVFGDVLEATYYGGVPMKLRILKSVEKLIAVLETLRMRPPEKFRTMIYCKTDNEIEHVKRGLTYWGYRCLAYYQSYSGIALRERVQCWSVSTDGHILVTAECPELNIRNVQSLIHLSMSSTWTKFKMRYLVFTDNLKNIFMPTPTVPRDLYSLVLLDETNNGQLPRVTDYLKRHQSNVSKSITHVAQRIRDDIADKKSDEPALCPQLMSFGQCTLARCNNRHYLVEYDGNLPDRVPSSGDIKFIMLKMYTPVHYCVRLLEHKSENGKWLDISESITIAAENIRLQILMNNPTNRVMYWPPKVKGVCLCHANDRKTYERVRILCVPDVECMNMARTDLQVEVQAMDTDRRAFWTTCGNLYVCPPAYLERPPQAIDIRLVGLVPRTGEHSWCEEDTKVCRDWLAALPQNSFLQAKVLFSTSHTIFIKELVALNFAPSLKLHVQLLNLRIKLCNELAIQSESTTSKVVEIFSNIIQISKPSSSDSKPKFITEDKIKLLSVDEQQKQGQQIEVDDNDMPMTSVSLNDPAPAASMPTNPIAQTTTQAIDNMQEPPQKIDTFLEMFECLKDCHQELGYSSVEAAVCSLFDNETDSNREDTNRAQKVEMTKPNVRAEPQPEATPPENGIFDVNSIISCPAYINPQITYYQTMKTLELQVTLPSDNIEYKLTVGATVVHLFTLNHNPQYGFCINMRYMYSGYKERLQGRTLYISIYKSLMQPYPMCFEKYKFMKPNYDKIDSVQVLRHGLPVSDSKQTSNYQGIRYEVEVQADTDSISDDPLSDSDLDQTVESATAEYEYTMD